MLFCYFVNYYFKKIVHFPPTDPIVIICVVTPIAGLFNLWWFSYPLGVLVINNANPIIPFGCLGFHARWVWGPKSWGSSSSVNK